MGVEPAHPRGVLDQVQLGMAVVDTTDEPVGVVVYVSPPSARVTPSSVAENEAEPELPEPERSELLRAGFIKVEGSLLGGSECYVKSDRVAAVVGNTVKLTLVIAGGVTG